MGLMPLSCYLSAICRTGMMHLACPCGFVLQAHSQHVSALMLGMQCCQTRAPVWISSRPAGRPCRLTLTRQFSRPICRHSLAVGLSMCQQLCSHLVWPCQLCLLGPCSLPGVFGS